MCRYCEETEYGHDPECPFVKAQRAGRVVRARRALVRRALVRRAASALLRGVSREAARGIADERTGNDFWGYEGEELKAYRRLKR